MFLKTSKPPVADKPAPVGKIAAGKKDAVPSIIAQDMHLLGNIVCDGTIDFDGKIDGNIRCSTLNVRKNGAVNGEITADDVFVYGKVKGVIRAKNVYLFAASNVEGIVMHESIAIEDGAFLDGKLKRTDKPASSDDASQSGEIIDAEPAMQPTVKLFENIRLIR